MKGSLFSDHFLHPKIADLDSNGRIKRSRTGHAYHKYVENWKLLDSKPVAVWSTPQDILGTVPADLRTMLNKVKSFMSMTDTGVQCQAYYHQPMETAAKDFDDCCKLNPIPHLHLLIENQTGVQNLHRCPAYKAVTLACKKTGFKTWSGAVPEEKLKNVIGYLCRPTYHYLGTNSRRLGYEKIHAKPPTLSFVKYGLAEEDEECDDSPINKMSTLSGATLPDFAGAVITNGFASIEEDENGFFVLDVQEERERPVKRAQEWLELEDIPKVVKKDKKLTQADMGVYIQRALRESGASTKQQMMVWVKKNKETVNEWLEDCCAHDDSAFGKFAVIMRAPGFQSLFNNAMELQAAEKQDERVTLLEYLVGLEVPHMVDGKEVATEKETGINFIGWCDEMSLNPKKIALEMLAVASEMIEGKNCFMIQGPTTCGKSYFFTEPFKLMIDEVGTVTNDERFGFMDCPQKTVLVMDEFKITSANVETYKSVMRGNLCKVDVKNKGHQTVHRTPMFGCCNNDPVKLLNCTDGEAVKKRMFFHQVSPKNLRQTRQWLEEARFPNPKYLLWLNEYFNSEPEEDESDILRDEEMWLNMGSS